MDFKLDDRLCDESICCWRKDLADKPILYDFIIAVWNKDSSQVRRLLHKDPLLRQDFLDYMEEAAKAQQNPEVLSVLLSRWINL